MKVTKLSAESQRAVSTTSSKFSRVELRLRGARDDGRLAGDSEWRKNVSSIRTQLVKSRLMQNRWVIDPRSSHFMKYWDSCTIAALIFTALATPFEVAFLPPPKDTSSSLFWINRVVDSVFLIDMFLCCFIMYKHTPRNAGQLNSSAAVDQSLHWEDNNWKIVRHYATTWFVPDLVSVAPSVFDILSTVQGGADCAANENTRKLKLMRVVRVCRLIKLVRLVKTSRVLKRWESHLSID
eukprot:4675806-Prymnesium_polylepis.3